MSRRLSMGDIFCVVLALLLLFVRGGASTAETKAHVVENAAENVGVLDGPSYTTDGRLKFPAKYREWVFLTSGLDMSYNLAATAAAKSVFDNVFVNPSAYRVFLRTGIWPDKTVLVLENRGGAGNQSINTRGKTQTMDVTGMEVHVKDTSRMKGGWAFYSFGDKVSAKLIRRPASCYSCHQAHGAVDTTFVQFYPTLMPIAKEKGTLSPEYLQHMDATPLSRTH